MQFRKLVDNRLVTVVAAATVVALIGAGAGYSAGTISSADIKDKTIKIKDLKPGTVKKLKGQTGATGPQGPVGPAGTGGAGGGTVVSLLGSTQPWDATNPSVSLTPDGVEFGPYADGALTGGSIYFNGLNGLTLAQVKNLVYYIRFSSTTSTTQEEPYLRIFLNNDSNDVIFSPSTQSPDPDNGQGEFNEYVVTSGSVRYDDDPAVGPDSPWATVVAAHGTDVISGIYITQGFSGGANVTGLLRWMQVNGVTYSFRGN
jgi:hypothetical protein